jgi:integrase
MSKVSKVTLREKEISKGRLSLYLDFYPPIINLQTGKPTRREYLTMYVPIKPKTVEEKKETKAIRNAAEAICAKRQMEFYKGSYGLEKNQKVSIDFLVYFTDYVKRYENGKKNTYHSWKSAYNHLNNFCDGKLNSDNLNKGFVESYRRYLKNATSLDRDKPLSQNTKGIYFNKFCSVVKAAKQDKYLSENPTEFIKGFKAKESDKEYLTLDELKQLFTTPFDDTTFINACKFATYTGLRHCDIKKMNWSEVCLSESLGNYLNYTQQKTGKKETLPIKKEAFELLGERQNDTDLVFPKMGCTSTYRRKLMLWTARAGIKKHITFHCLRHTNATLLLANGEDIYTVSKLLGHSSLRHTQVYAKVMDKSKVKAANSFPTF